MRREREQWWPEPDEDARDTPDLRVVISPARIKRLPLGMVFITRFVALPTRNPRTTRYTLTVVGGPDWPANETTVTTIDQKVADLAAAAWHTETPVQLSTKRTAYGYEVVSMNDHRTAQARFDSDLPDAQRNCPRHRWDSATDTVMRCRYCGFLWRRER
jgi:hypothetical protein